MNERHLFKRSGRPWTRRRFIQTLAVAGAAGLAGGLGGKALAADREEILIGRLNPSTGPLAAFGESSPWVDEKALAAINREGGLFIKNLGRKLPMRMKHLDTQSDPTRAGELAARLILKDQVDLMVALHTPAMVGPVAAACERYETPLLSLDAPIEPWLAGGPYDWSYHAFWSVREDFYPVCLGIWPRIPTNRVVGLVASNDPDGMAFVDTFAKLLPDQGYRVIEPGLAPYGALDFSSLIQTWLKEEVQILFGNMIPPDWTACWRQCRRMGFRPKIATIARAILFPSVVQALGGDLAQGLTTEVWWSPHHPFRSSLTGQTAKELCDEWTKETGKPWTQPLGFQHAAFEIAADVFRRAESLDKARIRDALAQTRLQTIVGPISFGPEHYGRTPLVGGQWVRSGEGFPWKLEIIHNKEQPQAPVTAAMVPVG
jgi:branched-chain amino acid transport system substrate-binding protein